MACNLVGPFGTLPVEICRLIFEALVWSFEGRPSEPQPWKALRYKLVCKQFCIEIENAYFTEVKSIEGDRPFFVGHEIMTRYLIAKITKSGIRSPFLLTINRTIESLMENVEFPSQELRDRYTHALCTAAVDYLSADLVHTVYDFKPVLVVPDDLQKSASHDLTAAAIAGNLSLARRGLENGADVNKASMYFGLPLIAAICAGHKDVVLLLLERGASTIYSNEFRHIDESKHHQALRAKNNNYGLAMNSYGFNNIFNIAILSDHPDILQTLAGNSHRDETTRSALTLNCLETAARYGSLKVMKMILDAGVDGVTDEARPVGITVSCAAMDGHLEAVRLLLARGIGRNRRHLENALYHAAKGGYDRLVRLLLDHGAMYYECY